MSLSKLFKDLTHFIWDEYNQNKNWRKHGVHWEECEQAIGDVHVVIAQDPRHSMIEQRWRALGRTTSHRYLFIAFTIRENGIRVISARPMNQKERRIYDETQENSNLQK